MLKLPDSWSWEEVMPPVRNQGMTQTCVCQSLTSILDFYVNAEDGKEGVCNNFSIQELYNSRSNKPSDGMSIKEAMHYLHHHGLGGVKIREYSMLMSELGIKNALMMFGPVVCGMPCYSGDQQEFWRSVGTFQGGHAVCLVGYDEKGFIIRNSWGTSWGKGGYMHIDEDVFAKTCFEAWTIVL